jgi:hypothetical protein
MTSSAVWTALSRLLKPSRKAPVRAVDDTKITGDLAVRRTLERLERAGTVMSLQSDDGTFDHVGKLLSVNASEVRLQLLPREGHVLDKMPAGVNVTASTDMGVLLFALHGAALEAAGLVLAPPPLQIVQVQSRRHFRVTGLNGPNFRAELVLPGIGKAQRLRNLSEEGVAFEAPVPGVPYGTLIHDAVLQLDGEPIQVPALQVMYCRDYGGYCAVGAHFEIVVADDVRLLRRWIAGAQSAMLASASSE